jgi:hypothetical protein
MVPPHFEEYNQFTVFIPAGGRAWTIPYVSFSQEFVGL